MERSKGWHKEDIKAAVRKRGTTLRAISEDAGLCRDAASIGLATQNFRSAHRVVAEFLGVSLNTLWPHWYNENEQSIDSRSKRKGRAMRRQAQSKKSNARGVA